MTALAWSRGKDSTLALHALGGEVRALMTTVVEGSGRVTVHGVPGELIRLPHCPTATAARHLELLLG